MQKKIITGALAALFVLAILGPAVAQERERARDGGQRPAPGQRFANMDTDGNGEVSKKEFMAASKERAKQMFARLDADGDGVITKEEMREAGQALRESRGGRGGADTDADQPERKRRRRPAKDEPVDD